MLNQILQLNFPQKEVALTFGYGSKVISQDGNAHGDLVDIIFVVDDSTVWHTENLLRNNNHYSALKYLSAERIAKIQENYGAKIYYNPYVRVANLAIKYGVIKTDHLIDDLINWTDLYVAGRLHKPVEFIPNPCHKSERLRAALHFNKESAIRAALIQLPEKFELLQLYKKITGLSYTGDFRMLFGEDKNKIENIVVPQVDRFDQLFLPILKASNFKNTIHLDESKRILTQDLSSATLFKYLKLLPANLRQKVCEIHGREARTIECDVVLTSLSRNINCDTVLTKALAAVVRRSSLTQSFKGLFTAGLIKSLKYSQRKLIKSFKSRLL